MNATCANIRGSHGAQYLDHVERHALSEPQFQYGSGKVPEAKIIATVRAHIVADCNGARGSLSPLAMAIQEAQTDLGP